MSAKPDVVYRKLGRQDFVLIMATDGVWDMVSDEEAIGIAQMYADTKDAILTAADIVQTARHRWEV